MLRLFKNSKIMVSKIYIWLSVTISLLVVVASLLGIINSQTYAQETSNWALQAIAQDYINLFLVAPLLLVASFCLLKNSLRALLVWLGLLLYLIYSYVLYSFFIHFGPLFLVYVAILGLSFYSFIGSLISLDWQIIGRNFVNVSVKAASRLLLIVGIMFYALWSSDIIRALISGGLPQDVDKIGLFVNPVQVLDLAFLLPGAIIVSRLLRRKNVLGQALAVPFLTFFITMGAAIISIMIVVSQDGSPLSWPPMAMMAIIITASSFVIVRLLKNLNSTI